MAQRKSQENVMGDLNVQNGKDENGEIVCKFEHDIRNEPGEN